VTVFGEKCVIVRFCILCPLWYDGFGYFRSEVKPMQFIMTFVWSFLLITTLNYVVSSVNAVPFDFGLGAIVSIVFAVMLFIMSMVLPEEPLPDYE
jgi:hypothetical protein